MNKISDAISFFMGAATLSGRVLKRKLVPKDVNKYTSNYLETATLPDRPNQ